MDHIQSQIDARIVRMVDELDVIDIASDDFTAASKNIGVLLQARTLAPEPEPDPDPVPVTRWEKAKATVAAVWDNETTRVFIKAGGAFGSVGLVVWSTVHRDHVMDRQALAQANQRNS